MTSTPGHRTPWWFTALLIMTAIPMVWLMGRAGAVLSATYDTDSAALNWFYPIYIMLSGVCAYLCYPDRRALAWILEALMCLTTLLLLWTSTNM